MILVKLRQQCGQLCQMVMVNRELNAVLLVLPHVGC